VRWKAASAALLVLGLALSGCISEPKPSVKPPPGRSVWAYNMTQVLEMHSQGFTGQGVTVGLVDSGIDLSHPEFANLTLKGWKDLVNGEPTPYDDGGHGTEMAGIIAGSEGAAPGAALLVAKAIRSDGTSTDALVAAGVRWCLDPDGDGSNSDSADLISLSLGGGRIPILGTETERACKEALSWGAFVVAAADNDGDSDDGDVTSPASVKNVIAVGAVNATGVIAPWSSAGRNGGSLLPPRLPRSDPDRKPEVVAPGVDLWCAVPGGGHDFGSGTSHAAAFVSGCLALVLGALPRYLPRNNEGETTIVKFKQALMDTALKLEGQARPHDEHYGYGLIQAAALRAALA
jgi:subtilisin family serine protease